MFPYKIIEVKNNKDLNSFVKFQRKLYKNEKYYIPPTDKSIKITFSPKNLMAENCYYKLCIVIQNKKIIGRIAAIINIKYNNDNNIRQAKFSHFDCINDYQVARILFDKVISWAKVNLIDEVIVPYGFTNLDKHGILIEGFNVDTSIASNYNFPYYKDFLEKYGFVKTMDWIEQKLYIPKSKPLRYDRINQIIQKRFEVKIINLKNRNEIENYLQGILDVYNICYGDFYGTTKLTTDQIIFLYKTFSPIIKTEYISIITDKKDKVVAFGIAMPSLSSLLKKAKGFNSLFVLLICFFKRRQAKVLDLLLIGVHPKYQKKGLNGIIFSHMANAIYKNKIQYLETNQNIETNYDILNLWSDFEVNSQRKSRLYSKTIIWEKTFL